MTQSSKIPFFQVNSESIGASRLFDAWRKALGSVFVVDHFVGAKSQREQIRGWLLDDLVFTETKFSPQRFKRDPSLTENTEFLALQIYTKGGCRAVVDGRTVNVLPGEIHVFDFSREFCSIAQESDMVSVFVPHAMIGYDPSRHPQHSFFSPKSPIGRLISEMIFFLLEELSEISTDDAKSVAKGFGGLLQKLIFSESPTLTCTQKSRVEKTCDIRAYISGNLSDADLGVEKICNDFNMSRATLYRAFEPLGGVANYISQRRLDKAYHILASGMAGDNRVKQVAECVGYQDPAHFSRLFKKRFSLTPTDVVRSFNGSKTDFFPMDALDSDIEHEQLGRWLRRIC